MNEENKQEKILYKSNDGVLVWVNTDKNGKKYFTVDIPLLKVKSACFKVEKKNSEE